jgi:hypothetical protein
MTNPTLPLHLIFEQLLLSYAGSACELRLYLQYGVGTTPVVDESMTTIPAV